MCKIRWDCQSDTEYLCSAHWNIIIFTLCTETQWKQNAIKWGQKQTSYVRLWFGTCVPMFLASFLPVNKRRKACGSWVLHGKLMYSFGHWKNEVMCWNWSHTWKTSGGKAEAREHWEHAQHCLSPRNGFFSWKGHYFSKLYALLMDERTVVNIVLLLVKVKYLWHGLHGILTVKLMTFGLNRWTMKRKTEGICRFKRLCLVTGCPEGSIQGTIFFDVKGCLCK